MDALLTAACLAVELGLPLAMAWAWRSRARLRPRLAVVFGAISPLLALYLAVAVGRVADPGDANRFAIGAVWLMTFAPYLLCAGLGAALSLVRRPEPLAARYLLGLAVPAALGSLLLV